MNTIYSINWDIGAHIPFYDNIFKTVSMGIELGMYSCQFFMGSPKSYNRSKINQTDIENTQKLLYRFPMNLFTHFPYIASLNGSANSLAWNGDMSIDNKMYHMMHQLEYEMGVLANFSHNGGVVIHPGCYGNREVGLTTISKTINKLKFTPRSKLILENCAGEGRKLCKNFDEIRTIFSKVDNDRLNNVGVCVDTAHIWGVGDYDLRLVSEVDRMFGEFDSKIGIDKLTVIHLNDSKVPKGSKKDRHELLGDGYIWGENLESLYHLLDLCQIYNIDIIMEMGWEDVLTMCKLSLEINQNKIEKK